MASAISGISSKVSKLTRGTTSASSSSQPSTIQQQETTTVATSEPDEEGTLYSTDLDAPKVATNDAPWWNNGPTIGNQRQNTNTCLQTLKRHFVVILVILLLIATITIIVVLVYNIASNERTMRDLETKIENLERKNVDLERKTVDLERKTAEKTSGLQKQLDQTVKSMTQLRERSFHVETGRFDIPWGDLYKDRHRIDVQFQKSYEKKPAVIISVTQLNGNAESKDYGYTLWFLDVDTHAFHLIYFKFLTSNMDTLRVRWMSVPTDSDNSWL